MSTTATLLITCNDQPGLVAAVSNFILQHGGNIIHADQHIDPEQRIFLQRVEWELATQGSSAESLAAHFAPVAERFSMVWSLKLSTAVPRLALLVSKQGHCLYDLLARWQSGEFKAEIAAVISNHRDLENVVQRFGVEFVYAPVVSTNKPVQEAFIIRCLNERNIDVVVLARYMQILGKDFVDAFTCRAINIHHSFLPAFPGARPYHRAHERGVKLIGATAHYVTTELDEGPIIAQDVVHVSHRDSVQDFVGKGRDLEKTVLARALDLHLRNRVLVYGNKTAVFG